MVRIELELLHLGNVDLRCLTFRRISVYLLKVRMSIKDTDARNKMIKSNGVKGKLQMHNFADYLCDWSSSYSGEYFALWLRRPGFDSRTGQKDCVSLGVTVVLYLFLMNV